MAEVPSSSNKRLHCILNFNSKLNISSHLNNWGEFSIETKRVESFFTDKDIKEMLKAIYRGCKKRAVGEVAAFGYRKLNDTSPRRTHIHHSAQMRDPPADRPAVDRAWLSGRFHGWEQSVTSQPLGGRTWSRSFRSPGRPETIAMCPGQTVTPAVTTKPEPNGSCLFAAGIPADIVGSQNFLYSSNTTSWRLMKRANNKTGACVALTTSSADGDIDSRKKWLSVEGAWNNFAGGTRQPQCKENVMEKSNC